MPNTGDKNNPQDLSDCARYLFQTCTSLLPFGFLRGYVPPSDEEVERGGKYCFQISLASEAYPGSVFVWPEDEPRWQFKTEPPRHAWSPLNLFGKPVFVLLDRGTREILRIRRRRRVPPSFEIVQNGEVVGTILRRAIVTYRVELVGGPTWSFRMPAFTQNFCAISSGNAGAWVKVVYSEMNWVVLVRPQSDDLRLVAALAFIHRERCAYT